MFILKMRRDHAFKGHYERGRDSFPWRSTIMRAATIPLIFLVTPLLAQAAQSAPTQPVPWHPCARIAAACAQAGFVPNGTKRGSGIMSDCIQPIMLGTPQRTQATKALPQIDPQVVAACKERNPNFGKGGKSKTQSSGV
jgi:hypothetical protein